MCHAIPASLPMMHTMQTVCHSMTAGRVLILNLTQAAPYVTSPHPHHPRPEACMPVIAALADLITCMPVTSKSAALNIVHISHAVQPRQSAVTGTR
jgi:hypothetical protein